MIMTLNTSQAANLLMENSSFSYQGAYAIVEYLEELEDDLGESIEFDAVAIRCDYSEFESAYEAAEEYGYDDSENEDETDREEKALNWLYLRSTVIEFDGGVVVGVW